MLQPERAWLLPWNGGEVGPANVTLAARPRNAESRLLHVRSCHCYSPDDHFPRRGASSPNIHAGSRRAKSPSAA
jgi:hypothetical protein